MKLKDLSQKQREFLKGVFELEELPLNESLESFLRGRGYKLERCAICGSFIFHNSKEYWNLTECLDDNSRLTKEGLICELCYSNSPQHVKEWIFFKPPWIRNPKF